MPASIACWLRVTTTSRTRAGWMTGVSVPCFHRGDLTAHRQTLGDDGDQRAVELIDAGTEIIEIGHRLHRTRSAVLRALRHVPTHHRSLQRGEQHQADRSENRHREDRRPQSVALRWPANARLPISPSPPVPLSAR